MRRQARLGWVAVLVVVAAASCDTTESEHATPATRAFTASDVAFRYPASWNARVPNPQTEASLFFPAALPLVSLSAQPQGQFCHVSDNGASCGPTVRSLEPRGALVTLENEGFPCPPDATCAPLVTTGGEARNIKRSSIRVGGQPATREVERPGWCSLIGGTETITVTLDHRDIQGSYLVRACLRGPDLRDSERQLQALLDSLEFAETRT